MKPTEIPTAEEVLNKHMRMCGGWLTTELAVIAFNEFAKLYVQSALEAAAEKAKIDYGLKYDKGINKQSILNAYSLDNIK